MLLHDKVLIRINVSTGITNRRKCMVRDWVFVKLLDEFLVFLDVRREWIAYYCFCKVSVMAQLLQDGIEISVVVPVYNEGENIPSLYERLRSVMDNLRLTFELIFVNDGSTDDSIGQLRQLSESDQSVRYLDLSRNFGHQIAVMAGL